MIGTCMARGGVIPCPVAGCPFEGTLSQTIRHINNDPDSDHRWKTLGFQNSYGFRKLHSHATNETSGTEHSNTIPNEHAHDQDNSAREVTESSSDFPDTDSEDRSASADDPDKQVLDAPVLSKTDETTYDPSAYRMVSPDDPENPYPNYVTELYESLLSHKVLLEHHLSKTIDGGRTLRDAQVQYFLIIQALISYGRLDIRYRGLGLQQSQRLDFNIQQYRDTFGDGARTRNYELIAVVDAVEDISSSLVNRLGPDEMLPYVRPVMPGTDRPIPFLPDTKQELLEAMRLLGTMPASPPLPTDPGHDHRRVPIASLYRSILGDLPEKALVDVRQLDPRAPAVSGPVAYAAVLTEAEIDARLRESPLTHQFRRVKPPMAAPYEGRFPVLAMGRYDSSDPAFSTIYRFATGQDDTADEEFIRRLQDMMYRRVVDDEWSFDLITAVPGHEAGSTGGRLNRVIERATEKTDIIDAALLRRTETVTPQKELGREEREAAAVDPSASLEVRKLLDGEWILLFDDICTSGSTMLGAAHLLEEAGAGFVVGLALALRGGMHDEVIRSRDRGLSEIISGVGR